MAASPPQVAAAFDLGSLADEHSGRDQPAEKNTSAASFFSLNSVPIWLIRASLVAQTVKNLSAVQETQVQSLG